MLCAVPWWLSAGVCRGVCGVSGRPGQPDDSHSRVAKRRLHTEHHIGAIISLSTPRSSQEAVGRSAGAERWPAPTSEFGVQRRRTHLPLRPVTYYGGFGGFFGGNGRELAPEARPPTCPRPFLHGPSSQQPRPSHPAALLSSDNMTNTCASCLPVPQPRAGSWAS
jgi:hypothetical protein